MAGLAGPLPASHLGPESLLASDGKSSVVRPPLAAGANV